MYLTLKIIHASCALLSVLGFAGRGFLKWSRGEVPGHFAFKVLPHIIDTVLLVSAITLVIMTRQYPFVSPWVTAKVVTLILYIGLGIVLMRASMSKGQRGILYLLTLLCGLYMILVAVSKNPLPLGL